MLFADELFWKPPNVYDAAGVVGLVLAVFSLVYAWYVARYDVRIRIRDARNELRKELSRRAVFEQLTEARQCARLAEEAVAGRSWRRAGTYCELADDRIRGLLVGGDLDTGAVLTLRRLSDNLSLVIRALGTLVEKKGRLADDVRKALSVVGRELREFEVRYRWISEGPS
jgi:hypothetical protein